MCYNKTCAFKLVFFNEKKWERLGWFLTQKIDFESQLLALFDTSPLHQFSKFNYFLCVSWFLGKNISNSVPPAWKLINMYINDNTPYFKKYFVIVATQKNISLVLSEF